MKVFAQMQYRILRKLLRAILRTFSQPFTFTICNIPINSSYGYKELRNVVKRLHFIYQTSKNLPSLEILHDPFLCLPRSLMLLVKYFLFCKVFNYIVLLPSINSGILLDS